MEKDYYQRMCWANTAMSEGKLLNAFVLANNCLASRLYSLLCGILEWKDETTSEDWQDSEKALLLSWRAMLAGYAEFLRLLKEPLMEPELLNQAPLVFLQNLELALDIYPNVKGMHDDFHVLARQVYDAYHPYFDEGYAEAYQSVLSRLSERDSGQQGNGGTDGMFPGGYSFMLN